MQIVVNQNLVVICFQTLDLRSLITTGALRDALNIVL